MFGSALEKNAIRRAEKGADSTSKEEHLSRHRPRCHDRGDQSFARVLWCRRRAHFRAGRRDAAPGADRHGDGDVQRHRAGPGHRGDLCANCGQCCWGFPGKSKNNHGRHRGDALWRRHLGFARRGHRRRGRAAGRQGAVVECPGSRLEDFEFTERAVNRSGKFSHRHFKYSNSSPSVGTGPRGLFPPRHAADEFPVGADGDAPLHAARIRLHLHQRHPGLAGRSGRGHGLRQVAQALVRRGRRHGDQPDAGGRADPRRRGAGHRRGALRGVPLQPRGAAAERQHGRLPGADVR